MKKLILSSLCILAFAPAFAQQAEVDAQQGYWRPILDKTPDTFWNTQLGYVFPAKPDFKAWDDIGIFEISGEGNFWYTETDFGGDFHLKGDLDAFILNGFDGVSSGYPMVAARLNLLYSQRFIDGYGMQTELMPGLYSTLDGLTGKDFALPFSLAAVKDVSPGFGALLGLSIYPGFDQTVDPKVALRWEISDDPDPGKPAYLTAEIGYPESKIRYTPDDEWALVGGFRMWNWPEFQMDEEDARERIMFDESRLFIGAELPFDEAVLGYVEAGYAFGRTIDFENNKAQAEVDLDNAPYLKIGMGGRW
ncbi:MAG: hypothetical protein U1F77_19040 [Kiritimatiellia bacterium]